MPEQYTYAVARIHAKEQEMLSMQDMEQLLGCRNVAETIAMLADKGYECSDAANIDEIAKLRRDKMWKLISELVEDMSVFDVFLYENDFHNLKAAVKALVTKDNPEHVFVDNGTVGWQYISDAVKTRQFENLPPYMKDAAEKAVSYIFETGDGGFCDVIIDKAYFNAIKAAGEKSENPLIRKYVEMIIAVSDIKIAARGCLLGKSIDFFRRSLAECETLNVSQLGIAAAKGFDDLCAFLSGTEYEKCVEMLKVSNTAFEKWCDDILMNELKKEKYNQFGLSPIVAYMLACETELKAVGLILTGKQNKLDDNLVRERLRELYV